MKIDLKAAQYNLQIEASKRELQELSCIVEQYLEAEYHTSGDNPAWDFMKNLGQTLESMK